MGQMTCCQLTASPGHEAQRVVAHHQRVVHRLKNMLVRPSFCE